MRFTASFFFAALPYLISAAPLNLRQEPAPAPAAPPAAAPAAAVANQVLVFTFANVLEQFESQFYKAALAKFSGADLAAAGVTTPSAAAAQLSTIQGDEAAHEITLRAALATLGAQPLTCQFNFEPVLGDVSTVLFVARKVEQVGISAYMGAVPVISGDNVSIEEAASIMVVESAHEAVLNLMNGATPVPNPQVAALLPNEVVSLVSPFISGCDLGIAGNPTLTVTNPAPILPNTQLAFSSSAISGDTSSLFCQMLIGDQALAIVQPFNNCVVPAGANGPVYVLVTKDDQPLPVNVAIRTSDTTVAGPDAIFVDPAPDLLAQLIRTTTGAAAAPPANGAAAPAAPPAAPPVNAAPAPPSADPNAALPPAAPADPNAVPPVAGAPVDPSAAPVAGAPAAPSDPAAPVAPPTNATAAEVPIPPAPGPVSSESQQGISMFDGAVVVMGSNTVPASALQPPTIPVAPQ